MNPFWEKQVKELPLLEGEWERPFTSDAEDAAEEHTTLRKSSVQLAAMGPPLRLSGTHGRLRILSGKDFTSFGCYVILSLFMIFTKSAKGDHRKSRKVIRDATTPQILSKN